MNLQCLTVGPLETNCYVVSNAAGEAFVIDPGGDAPIIAQCLDDGHLRPRAFLLTHGHFDHVGALPELAQRYPGVPVVLDPADEALYASPRNCMLPYCAAVVGLPPTVPDCSVDLPDLEFAVLRTPGHTPGGRSLYFAAARRVFAGDVLFCGGVGRTDFPGGDEAALGRAIREVLFALPDDTEVLPGHGPATTIGDEKVGNPWIPQG